MLTYHEKLDRMCKRRGYTPINVETLWLAVSRCTIYKFRRDYTRNWQYLVRMPGYGKTPIKQKWVEVQIIGRNE
jgi:hypothetical protein